MLQQYMSTWPGLCASYDDPNGRMMGYILGKVLMCVCVWHSFTGHLGKAEGRGKLWHGHVTAVTVSPEYRRLGVATQLMDYLETVSQEIYNAIFVDLFVRVSNKLAQVMYANLSYTVYRQVCASLCHSIVCF